MKGRVWIARAGRQIGNRWLPARCLLCGGHATPGLDLCSGCAADLPRNAACCARCALPLAHPAAMCGPCQRHPPPWHAAWVPFRYAWPLDRLATRYKFSANLAAGRTLAALWREHPPPALPQAVVPIPLHRARLRERGYDQAHELARQVAQHLQLPLLDRSLYRRRATTAQSTLDAVARRRNVHGAFALRASVALPAHVALFDDVLTTGATLGECTRVLLRAGVARVDVWALARVAAPGSGAGDG